jgi:hypothetical protein
MPAFCLLVLNCSIRISVLIAVCTIWVLSVGVTPLGIVKIPAGFVIPVYTTAPLDNPLTFENPYLNNTEQYYSKAQAAALHCRPFSPFSAIFWLTLGCFCV